VLDVARGSAWPTQWPGRALRNAYSDTWHGREEELRADPVRSDEPAVWAGQAVGLVRERRSAADVVADLATAETLLTAWCG
jgi:nitronate monooxygenase